MGLGPVSGPQGDAIRDFEELSRSNHEASVLAHARDPSVPITPIYHVISGQEASRDMISDPTRFLVGVAGGMPPDVIRFDRYAVTEWAARGAFADITPLIDKDRASGSMGMMMAGSLLMTTPVILIFFFAQKYFIQGVTLTGMKG